MKNRNRKRRIQSHYKNRLEKEKVCLLRIKRKRDEKKVAKNTKKGIKRHPDSPTSSKICNVVVPERPTRPSKFSKVDVEDDNPPLGAEKSNSENQTENIDQAHDDNSAKFNRNRKHIIEKLEMELTELKLKVNEQELNIKKADDTASKHKYQNILVKLVEEQLEKL